MEDDAKRTLTPKVRFPEFRDGWENTTLGQVVDFQSGGTPSKDTPAFWNGSIPWVTAKDMKRLFLDDTEDHITTAATDDGAKQVPAGTVLMLVRGMTLLKDVPICVLCRPMSFNQDVKALRPNGPLSERFLPWLLLSSKERLLRMVDVAGHGTGKFNTDELKSLNLALPSPAEQQKIADCLTSLDEVIAAQGRNVEALKAQKKGLMQQLFPREGEALPCLRFPEFRDGPEWKSVALGAICRFVRGPFGGALKKDIFVREGYAVYEQSHAIDNQSRKFRYFISAEKYDEMKRFAVRPNDIIMSCSGTMGKFAQLPREPIPGVINQALLKLTVQTGYNAEFVLVVLGLPITQSKLLTQSAGGAIKNVVGVPQLKEITVPIPSEAEQRRIADCLSALDARIAAEAEKFAALKTHKRGLMEQLFPSPEGE